MYISTHYMSVLIYLPWTVGTKSTQNQVVQGKGEWALKSPVHSLAQFQAFFREGGGTQTSPPKWAVEAASLWIRQGVCVFVCVFVQPPTSAHKSGPIHTLAGKANTPKVRNLQYNTVLL